MLSIKLDVEQGFGQLKLPAFSLQLLLENCIKHNVISKDKLLEIAVSDSIEQSVKLLSAEQPDLIFMDIQLADRLSFEIFNRVTVNCPVVFC